MVDDRDILKQYSYKATSNLVLQQDRASRPDRNTGTGEVGPLKRDELPGRMGDRARRHGEKSAELPERLEKRRQRAGIAAKSDILSKNRSERKFRNGEVGLDVIGKDVDVVDVANELDLDSGGGGYVPMTNVSQKAFEALLSFIMSKIGDQPHDLLRSAADEALAILKDQRLQEKERKKLIDEMMASKMSADEFSRLSMLGRQIKDFPLDEDAGHAGSGELGNEAGEEGLPVVFDSDDGEGDKMSSDDNLDEVVDLRDVLGDEPNLRRDLHESGPSARPERDVEKGQFLPRYGHGSGQVSPLETWDGKMFDANDVDGYWLQRVLSRYYTDTEECQKVAEEVLSILSRPESDRMCENRLVALLHYDKFDFISTILENRTVVVFRTRWARASDADERRQLEIELRTVENGASLLQQLRPGGKGQLQDTSNEKPDILMGKELEKDQERKDARLSMSKSADEGFGAKSTKRKPKFALRRIDLESLAFQKGGRLMTVRDCKLPSGSEHIENKDYEEWHIPALRAIERNDEVNLKLISSLPRWCQEAFPATRFLNRIQSSAFSCAFESDENILLCAPTGAGKTNVAVLTILRAISNSSKSVLHTINDADLSAFKVVYVAPMKALVAEVVENLGKRLGSLGLVVRELTGDVNLSKQEIDKTQVIVTTPEKWDIITRKSGERAFTSLVRLLIIDEVHLLHDERGPVLESIVARTSRSVESLTANTRVVGLSATLPNFKDVAAFLRVNLERGLFQFDSSYRPCPLQQCYVGVTAKRALKRFQLMNELAYAKVMLQLRASNQVIIFVHSRKETISTCQFLINKAIEDEFTDQFMKPGSASFEVVQSELPNVESKELAGILEYGLAAHHAGMSRSDRQLVEALFEDGQIKVLVSTATLAWGVNLPAHAVIIKGTQVYSPQHGRWIELSLMDVMQMMGRAGRPQFDTQGEGIIITTKVDVLYYLSLLNQQLPIESQFVSRLVDMLNAEVAMGSVSSVIEGASWLCYSYLYVRMLRNPGLYGIAADEHGSDPNLERRRAELIHAAAIRLDRSGLVRYDKRVGTITGTGLGRVAADYYVGHETMAMYVEDMKPTTTDIDILRLFSSSGEFRQMRVREEEKLELARLAERIPIPVKEALDEPSAKVNILLQAFISKLSLDGLALKADMVYVTQSAARLARALHQVAYQMKSAPLMERCLSLCKNVSARQWTSQTPLRQFQTVLGDDVLHKIERKDVDFERYYDLTVAELGELLRNPRLGRTVHRLVHSLPRLELSAQVRPLSRSLLEIDLSLTPNFRFDRKLHRSNEPFWITVEDADSEVVLHSELFFLRRSVMAVETSTVEYVLNFTVQLSTPQPPQYFIRSESDDWIVPKTILPVSFQGLLLPEKFAPPTKLRNLRPMAVLSAFPANSADMDGDEVLDRDAQIEALAGIRAYFKSQMDFFTPLQTHVFQTLYESDSNTVLATLPNCERFQCAELCLARLFSRQPTSLAVWIVGRGRPAVESANLLLSRGIGKSLGLQVGTFLLDTSEELALLRSAGVVVVTTAQRWDMFTRKWRQKRERKIMSRIGLVIVDGIHAVARKVGKGAALEIMCSRLRYIAADATENGDKAFRIVALGDPIANAKEIGHWLGCPPSAVFSFHPKEVESDLQFEVAALSVRASSMQIALAANLVPPVYAAIRKHVRNTELSVLVYVPSRKMARSLALEIVGRLAQAGSDGPIFQKLDNDSVAKAAQFSSSVLNECMSVGVSYLHDTMREQDRSLVEEMFRMGKVKVLVAIADYAWRVRLSQPCLVIVAGTARTDEGAYALRRAEYENSDLLKMICPWQHVVPSGKVSAVIITAHALQDQYERQCLEPVPVESQLMNSLSDHLNAEIAAGVIETKQDAVDYLTWTFFYRRLPKNPNYYGLKGLSHLEISNHLSEIVDTALSDLEASKCVAAEGKEDIALGKLNLGVIAAHYYIRHATVELFASSLTPRTKAKGLLDVLSLASEFGVVPVRIGDEQILQSLSSLLPVSLDEDGLPSFSSPHVKTHLLLQAQLGRVRLSAELMDDQKIILPIAVRLLRAMVDVTASAGWLKPALEAVELSRMLIQGQWDSDSSLIQLPHVDKKLATTLEKTFKVSDIFQFFDMDSKTRSKAQNGLSKAQVVDIDAAWQALPNLQDVEIDAVEEMHDDEGRSITRLVIIVERNEEDYDGENSVMQGGTERVGSLKVPVIHAPFYPERKEEGWWIIIGEPKTNSLLTLKHITLKSRATIKLEFPSPLPVGKHQLQWYLRSDSYLFDFDQEENFGVLVTQVDYTDRMDFGNNAKLDGAHP